MLLRRFTALCLSSLCALPALADTTAGEGQTLAWGPWHVPGIFGIINNTFACLFMIIIWFFSFWPPMLNPTVDMMNYSVLVTGFVAIFSVVYYFVRGRKEYNGPIVET